MARPPAPALDVIAARNAAAKSNNTSGLTGATAATAAAEASGAPSSSARDPSRPSGLMAPEETRDSRSSSSTNSPAPADNEESDFFLAANDSQSSLGVVPNLQDMQVADAECLPAVQALPSEVLISIFSRISEPKELLNCMLTCKRWARNVVEILWHRPTCTSWKKLTAICNTLGSPQPFFTYADFIKRLNLAALPGQVNDGSIIPLSVCSRVERLTLTSCSMLTDVGVTPLVKNNHNLMALDLSNDHSITETTIIAIAENCRKLQGLNISGCRQVSNESLIQLAKSCRYIKRLKLNDCQQLTDEAVLAFAAHCPNILEMDLHQCPQIGNEPVTALLSNQRSLREFRLANCELIDDNAFLSLSPYRTYENLRILDLTSCTRLTDRAVEKIIDIAPRLRNLVVAKCTNLTDLAVHAIAKLGKNLHYVHLGHCRNITDEAVKRLVRDCNRIRYIDLGCCSNLTDESVMMLATLPKLKRIGLVKCIHITDKSMLALATANDHRSRYRSATHGPGHEVRAPSLERVHLSYCTNLTLPSIIKLLNCCPKLTHLSLTGVPAFLRDDLEDFCREAPQDFTENQRAVFCVFSGTGVVGLRNFFNTKDEFAEYRDGPVRTSTRVRATAEAGADAGLDVAPEAEGFEDGYALEDDDMGDGSDLIDVQNGENAIPPPPPPPPAQPASMAPLATLPNGQAQAFPSTNGTALDGTLAELGVPSTTNQAVPANQAGAGSGPSTAGTSLFGNPAASPGPSTAPMQGSAEDPDTQMP
ncbi:RNI-like protein [Poronia punctata]|nr:RNI-like protein [Poronia punctata]